MRTYWKAIPVLTLIALLVMQAPHFLKPATADASSAANPFLSTPAYVDTESLALKAYQQLKTSNPADAAQINKIASTAQASWFGEWSGDIKTSVGSYVSRAAAGNTLPVLVSYNIPGRDCGNYSAGGASTTDAYKTWIDGFAAGIGSRKAVVVFEPDGLGLLSCLSDSLKSNRLELYRYAMSAFSQNPNTTVYIDASMWIDPASMAQLLAQAGIQKARGIVVNVSGYKTTDTSLAYIRSVKSALNMDIHGMIDTSRNGVGPDPSDQWCNPPGRALGAPSSAQTADAIVDAYYWVKRPGESDGTCNGGPSAGSWWQSAAIDLATRSPFFGSGVITPPETGGTTSSSTIKVYAAGTPLGNVYPSLDLLIKGVKVKTFGSIVGNPTTRTFVENTFTQTDQIKPEDVRLSFTNDASGNGEDRNVMIDKITIDGKDYQTEAASTYSTGTWNSATGCNAGNKQSEWLHCGGYVQYAADTVPTTDPTPTPTPTPSIPPKTSGYLAEYFNGRDMSGTPTLVRDEPNLDYSWGGGSPSPTIGNDNFSARWTKTQEFAAGRYTFTVTADDGIRLSIDGTPVINQWKDQAATTYTYSTDITAGTHAIKVEYYECGGDATAKLAIAKETATPAPTQDGFAGEYFNNRSLSGTPVYTHTDSNIGFNWGGGSPSGSVPSDNFSARWTKSESFSAGTYTFTVTGDDGYRLYIDGQCVIDRWQDQGTTAISTSRYVSEGTHAIKLEYYENGGEANIKLAETR